MRIPLSLTAVAVFAVLPVPVMAQSPEEQPVEAYESADQDTIIQSWSADKQASYNSWPAETQTYYWTLSDERQMMFWALTDADKVTLSGMSGEEQSTAWERIEARSAPPGEAPEASDPG